MIITPSSMTALYTGFKGAFAKGYDGSPTAYKDIALTVPSTTSEETYAWLGQIPKLREWIGDRVLKQVEGHSYKVKNKVFEDTITVKRETIEDDQYNVYGPLLEQMGQAAAEMPDELVFSLLLAGFSTTCYDGQNFFDTDHPVVGADGTTKTTASNMQTLPADPGDPWFLLDCSRSIKPLIYQERIPFSNLVRLDSETDPNVFFKREYIYGVDGRGNAGFGLWQLAYGSRSPLTPENYAAARAAMMTLRGDAGRKLNIRPDTLVVGPNHEAAARKILNNATGTGGATNEWAGSAKLIVTSWAAPN